MRVMLVVLVVLCGVSSAVAQDFWQGTNGPEDYYVGRLIQDSSGILYAATGNSLQNLYRSTDNGASWVSRKPAGPVRALAVNARGHVYALYRTPLLKDTLLNGIWRSMDGCQTWDSVLLQSDSARAITFDHGGGIVYANEYQLRRSTDDGATWSDIRISRDSAQSLTNQVEVLAVDATGRIYAGTRAGLFRSQDNGAHWQVIGNASFSKSVLTLSVSSGVLFVGTDSALFRSTDDGATWLRTGVAGRSPISIASGSGSDVFAAPYGDSVFHSTDNGATWAKSTAAGAMILQLLQSDQGTVLAASSRNGLFRSTDAGVQWARSTAGMHTVGVTAVAAASDGRVYASVSDYAFVTDDRGRSWHGARIDSVSKLGYCLGVAPGGTVYLGTYGSGIYRSTDHGTTWQKKNTGLTDLTILSLAFLANGDILAGTNKGLWRSTNQGEAWSATSLQFGQVWSLALHPSGVQIAGLNGGGLRFSTDGGSTWSNGKSNATTDIQTIQVAPDGSLYAGTFNSGIYRSVDTGRNWAQVFSGRSTIAASVVTRDGSILVGGAKGVKRTIDAGVAWDSVNVASGLGSVFINGLACDSSGYVYAATNGLGVYRSTGPFQSGVNVGENALVPGLTLERSVPNPVASNASIAFTLTRAGFVQLALYDRLGCMVACPVDGVVPAGEHRVILNCEGLSSGIYYYQLRVQNEVVSHSLVISH